MSLTSAAAKCVLSFEVVCPRALAFAGFLEAKIFFLTQK
jgi:hypothetical protein